MITTVTALFSSLMPMLTSVAAGYATSRIAKRFPLLWRIAKTAWTVRETVREQPKPYVVLEGKLRALDEFTEEEKAGFDDATKKALGIG